ncbi:hypothetical protein AAHE18_09G158100 [Arachis hypogaea]|nr:uncharacterized protein LOC112711598 [Arachis hypogaea]XP_025620067.1 uncharacterized protein LOC112711598 [Arachis hypogaea]QHO35551.1 uncharacterized protein DS421_9g276400 [Arachis hypogaea]
MQREELLPVAVVDHAPRPCLDAAVTFTEEPCAREEDRKRDRDSREKRRQRCHLAAVPPCCRRVTHFCRCSVTVEPSSSSSRAAHHRHRCRQSQRREEQRSQRRRRTRGEGGSYVKGSTAMPSHRRTAIATARVRLCQVLPPPRVPFRSDLMSSSPHPCCCSTAIAAGGVCY